MTLSDRDLNKEIKERRLVFVPKLAKRQINAASIDLRLGSEFKLFRTSKLSLLDPKKGLPKDFMEGYQMEAGKPFILHPTSFILASTLEYMKVPANMVARAERKSTLARMGILVHTAGFVDPGFEGTLTLEISNQSDIAVALYPGMYICQIAVEYLSSPAQAPYNVRKKSLYHKSKGAVAANPKNLF